MTDKKKDEKLPEIHAFGDWSDAPEKEMNAAQKQFVAWLRGAVNVVCQRCAESELFCDKCRWVKFEARIRREFHAIDKYRQSQRDMIAKAIGIIADRGEAISPELDLPTTPFESFERGEAKGHFVEAAEIARILQDAIDIPGVEVEE